jgi:hypothetical protein
LGARAGAERLMAEEQIYEPRVAPEPAAPMPLARPEDYGAQLGQSLGQAGDVVNRAALQQYTQDRQLAADRELAQYGLSSAVAKGQADEQARYLRNNPAEGDPDYGQHVAQMRDALEQQGSDLVSGIKEGSVRRHAEQDWGNFTGTILGREGDFAESKRVANYVLNTGAAQNVSANTIRNALDPEQTLNNELASADSRIAASQVDPELKKKLAQQFYQAAYGSYLDRITMGSIGVDGAQGSPPNPTATIALIDSGKLAGSGLTQDQLEAARNQAFTELRRQQAELHQTDAAEKARLADDMGVARARTTAGLPVTNLPDLRARALKLGDNSTVADVENMARDSAFQHSYETTEPAQIQQRITALQAVPEAKRTDDQHAELKYLTEHQETLASGYNDDTAGWYLKHGAGATKPPPLDPAALTPQDLQRRADWRRQRSIAAGRDVPMFTKDEASQLRANAEANPQGEYQLAERLSHLGGREAINAARFVDPSNAMLQQLVVVPPGRIGLVGDGAATRKEFPQLVDVGENEAMARDEFLSHAGNAFGLLPPAQSNAVFEIARSLYARAAIKNGWQSFRPSNFTPFIDAALDQHIGDWNGSKVILPWGYDETRFNKLLGGYEPSANTQVTPYYPNGQKMTGDQLRQYTPRLRPDGWYQFMGPGNTVVKTRSGDVFKWQPSAVPRPGQR